MTREYKCKNCGKFDYYSKKPIKKCPKCNKPVKLLISSPSFILKGSGFHKTDYK